MSKGAFIVWHRYFVAVYEQALRNECGYQGAQPYWNTANDIATGTDMNLWRIFSNTTGFGGNGPYVSHVGVPNPFDVLGMSGGGCVPGGPFGTSNMFQVNIGPTANTSIRNPSCVKRDFAQPTMAFCQQSNVDVLLSQATFPLFAQYISDIPGSNVVGIHGNGHLGIGGTLGQMSNFFNSPAGKCHQVHNLRACHSTPYPFRSSVLHAPYESRPHLLEVAVTKSYQASVRSWWSTGST